MRFFRADEVTYEAARASLDAAFGFPNTNGTKTAIAPAEIALRDADGMVLFAMSDAAMDTDLVDGVFSPLIEIGDVEEISRLQYMEIVNAGSQGEAES